MNMHKDDYIKAIDTNAMRRFSPGKVELRSSDDGAKTVRGYAAKFNTISEDFGGFVERIAPGFFDEVLTHDVRALFNHDPNLILARSGKTLRLGVDLTGLWYEYTDPETSYSRDLVISISRGDVDQSSFAFTVKEDKWEKVDGQHTRTLIRAGRLLDVSPVTYPAYPDTEASMRAFKRLSMDEAFNSMRDPRQRRFNSLKIKNKI